MLIVLSLLFPALLIGAIASGSDDDDDAGLRLEGDGGDDTLAGGQASDFIDGGAGNDIMEGLAGNDTILGREGEDVLQGQDGDDMLCSGDGDDIVTGNTGADFIEGQGGDDFLSGDYGHDIVNGDEGNDTVIGGRGYDVVAGFSGDDVLFGGIIEGLPLNLEEMEALRDGTSLEDVNGRETSMRDDSLGNELYGGGGDDTLFVGSQDRATGGTGADTFNLLSDTRGDGMAVINDYDRSVDTLTIVVDGTTDLGVSIVDRGGDALIRLGDRVIGCVQGGAGSVTAADVSIISEASVNGLFDPNA